MKKADILKLGNIEAMVLCNEIGLPEGSRDEMVAELLGHFGLKSDSTGPLEG